MTRMRAVVFAVVAALSAGAASGSWYWPFKSTEEKSGVTIEAADALLCGCRLDEARTVFVRLHADLESAVSANPDNQAASNMLAIVDSRIAAIDEEAGRDPPLGKLMQPVLKKMDEADASMDDGKPKDAERLYLEILTNALPTVVTQDQKRARMPLFMLTVDAQTAHATARLREIRKDKRLSDLMEPASLLIDDATDLLNDGKAEKAVEKYREALRSLERLETEYPERAATPEFQSVRNKRAYVDAQLNAILLEEARLNAKSVAVTDTTELERKLAEKRAKESAAPKGEREKMRDGSRPKLESELEDFVKDAREHDRKLTRAAATEKFERECEERVRELLKTDPESRKARLIRIGLELHRGKYGLARAEIGVLLAKDPNDVAALNLLGAVESEVGEDTAAERAFVKAIRTNPRDHHAYYNLAKMLVRRGGAGNLRRAKTLYDSGHESKKKDGSAGPGGPADPYLEKAFRK